MIKWLVNRSMLSAITPHNAAYFSAFCLVVIQVSIGIIMKSSQTKGRYSFSTSGSVTISEFIKFLLSASVILYRCHLVRSTPGYTHIPLSSSPRSSCSDELSSFNPGKDEQSKMEQGTRQRFDEVSTLGQPKTILDLFLEQISQVSVENRFGFAKLALLYSLINNTIFVAYKLADPGTIALTRSGVILITALVMVATLRTEISKIQWISIVIQICGLITTQYRPETGSSYPYSTYAVLLAQVFVSAVAGVYNQHLLKADHASLHAQNTLLYACGVLINGFIHMTLRFLTADEPGFLSGYNSIFACLVIVSNVFMGLAITAVYKSANAVVKCLATAVATGILLYLSPLLFHTEMSPLTVPGGLIVFITSWLYMDSSPPSRGREDDGLGKGQKEPLKNAGMGLQTRAIILLVSFIGTISTVVLLDKLDMPDFYNGEHATESEPRHVITSPFHKTLGFIRWNSHHPERLPLLQKYSPFFHDLHISMPKYTLHEGRDKEFVNTTVDNWENQLLPYIPVARTMQYILDQPKNSSESEIEGIFYFHFDAWINPMEFVDENFNNIWMPYSLEDKALGGGPTNICMTDRARYPAFLGHHTDRNWQYPLIEAQKSLANSSTDYVFNTLEWCTGWSDIYYIPRHLWPDYIYLSAFFGATQSFHEMAIPTMMHIIDQSRRQNHYNSIINLIGDCFGGCCNHGAALQDVLTHRCGHALNYMADSAVITGHYGMIDTQAAALGKNVTRPAWKQVPDKERDFNVLLNAMSPTAIEAYRKMANTSLINTYKESNMPDRLPFNLTGIE